ncbi:hypothetical protein Gotur_018949 [Gossypium turneri]
MLSSVAQKLIGRRFSPYPSSSLCILSRYFSSDSGSNNSVLPEATKLTRTPVLVEGCDYEHWFVVMEAAKGYPLRDEIVGTYIKTLAMALGIEEDAKKSIYSVSTKYYYAFGCKVPEDLVFKIKTLPNVKWVLPDSYSGDPGDNSYGGEPFIDGKVVPYDDKYHSDWIQARNDDRSKRTTHPRKASRKQKKQRNERNEANAPKSDVGLDYPVNRASDICFTLSLYGLVLWCGIHGRNEFLHCCSKLGNIGS